MLAPIDHAWMLLKAGPTEREQRNMNEDMEFDASMVDSHHPYNRGEEEGNQELSDNSTTSGPTDGAPIDAAMAQLDRQRGEPSWQEGPTLGEMADMDPEEGEHHMREAGRRSAAPSNPPQRTLHDY